MPKVSKRKSLRQKQKQCQRQNVKQTVKINLVAAARARARRRNLRRGSGPVNPAGPAPPYFYPPPNAMRPSAGPPGPAGAPGPAGPPGIPGQLGDNIRPPVPVPVLVDPIRAERQPQPYNIFYDDFEEIRVPQQQRAQAMLQIAPPDAPPLLQIEPEGVAVPVEAEPVIPRPGFRFPRIPDYLRVGGFRRGDLPDARLFNPIPRPIPLAIEAAPAAAPPDAPPIPAARAIDNEERRREELAARERALAEGRRINQQFQEFDAFFVAPPPVERQQPEQAIQALPAPYEWQTDRLKEQYDAARTVAAQNDVVQLDRQVRDQRANARRYEQDLARAGIQNEQKAQIERENQLIQRRMERTESDRKRDEENILAASRFRQKLQDDNSIDEIFAPMEAKRAEIEEQSRQMEMSRLPEPEDPWKEKEPTEQERQRERQRKRVRLMQDEAAGLGAGAPPARERGLQPQLPMSIFAYDLPKNVTGRTKERTERLPEEMRGRKIPDRLLRSFASRVPTVMGVVEQPERKRMVSADPSAERQENLFAQQQLVQRNPDDLQKANAPLEGFGNLDLSNISVYDFDGSGGSRTIASAQSLEDTISEIENQ